MSLPGAQNQSEPENATIKQMREAHEKAVADAKAEREAREALEIRLKAIEDEKLTAGQKREQENIENVKELVSELEDWEPMEMQLAKINSTTSQGDYENGNEKGNSSRQQKRGKRVKDLQ